LNGSEGPGAFKQLVDVDVEFLGERRAEPVNVFRLQIGD
jgi:hypothetical protein